MATLRRGAASEPGTAVIIGALAAAGTHAAQEGLVEILSDSGWSARQRESARFAFANVEEPFPEVDDVLRALNEEGEDGGASLLLLGAVAARVKESDPTRHEEVAAYLEAHLERPDLERGERIAAIEAIGNLEAEATPGSLLAQWESEDEAIRGAVLHALRDVRDDAATGLLGDALRSDGSEPVRLEAVAALEGHAGPEVETLLRKAALEDPSPEVRKRALAGTFARPETLDAEALAALAAAAMEDESEEVRELARELSRGSEPSRPE
jgi:HEAT repeat protein